MKNLILSLTILFIQSANGAPMILDLNKFDGSKMPFLTHTEALAMNLNGESLLSLREKIEKKLSLKLTFFKKWNAAGEAHITVITPPEMDKLTQQNNKYLSLARINEIAVKNNIQQSPVKISGLGSGSIKLNNQTESTFFILVEAPLLLKIREEIAAEFIKNGGTKDQFNPLNFYPHITLGYTLRDLHESDGIIKSLDKSKDARFNLVTK